MRWSQILATVIDNRIGLDLLPPYARRNSRICIAQRPAWDKSKPSYYKKNTKVLTVDSKELAAVVTKKGPHFPLCTLSRDVKLSRIPPNNCLSDKRIY